MGKPRKSKSYAIGSWFCVDLGRKQWVADWFGKWALGVVTHGDLRGVAVAYFFGPYDRLPTLDDARATNQSDGIPLLIGDPYPDVRAAVWRPASQAFAEGARGDIHVFFGPTVNPDSVWRTVEEPTLRDSGLVDRWIFHYL
jgi:hypothetical protein